MYQALLTRKYLTSKIMPLLAVVAVALSVATVLVTWSVMGGFLETLLGSGRRAIGDVKIQWPNAGFPHYDDLIERLEEHPDVEAAAPGIESFAVLPLPGDRIVLAKLLGIRGEAMDRVTGYGDTIWWKPLPDDERAAQQRAAQNKAESRGDALFQWLDPRAADDGLWGSVDWAAMRTAGLTLTEADGSPAAVLGIETSGMNQRTGLGDYIPVAPSTFTEDGGVDFINAWLPDDEITLHVMPLTGSGVAIDPVTRTVPVANEIQTGNFDVDSSLVLLRLDLAQRMLRMHELERVTESAGPPVFNPQTGTFDIAESESLETVPARVTTVFVRSTKESTLTTAELEAFRETVTQVYREFAVGHIGEVPLPGDIQILTWRDINRFMIAAVEKETGLVLFVFTLVCFTTVFLVLAIFWSMVSEKTRDIGILRALGGSTLGITWLWVRYGGAVGLVGASIGVTIGLLVVWRLNEIHAWMGETLGLVIWDPSVYYFVEIPSDLDPAKAAVVAAAGVITCLLGAAVPALRAGLMDPVRSLRFE